MVYVELVTITLMATEKATRGNDTVATNQANPQWWI